MGEISGTIKETQNELLLLWILLVFYFRMNWCVFNVEGIFFNSIRLVVRKIV